MFFGFLQVFQVLCRLTVNPGLSRGISVCFSVVVVAWQTVRKPFGAVLRRFWEKSRKIGIFRKVPKIDSNFYQKPHNDLRGPGTACPRYSELEYIFYYQFNAVLTKFWVNFCKFSQFSAVFEVAENYPQILPEPSQRHRKACKRLPTLQQTQRYSFGCSRCSLEEVLAKNS